MICCSKELLNSGVTESWAELEIAEYALAQNLHTNRPRNAMGRLPRTFSDSAEHRERTDDGYQRFKHSLNNSAQTSERRRLHLLRRRNLRLRDMFEQGALQKSSRSSGHEQHQSSPTGHAGLCKDTGTLIWLNAIYGRPARRCNG